jgi:hypothetical protein
MEFWILVRNVIVGLVVITAHVDVVQDGVLKILLHSIVVVPVSFHLFRVFSLNFTSSQSPTEPSVQPLSPPAMQQPSNTLPPQTLSTLWFQNVEEFLLLFFCDICFFSVPMRSTATRYSIFTIFMVLVLVWVLF